jgi:glycine cleavage system H lipoate-binding protein
MRPTTCLKHSSKIDLSPCLWMQAGVVAKKACKSNYQCGTCPFDRALRGTAKANMRLKQKGTGPKGKRGKVVFWKDKLKALPPWKRPCLHSMKGRIDFRACTHEYHCADCEFDQYFDDQHQVHTVVTPVDIMEIEGFKIPQGYYFHKGHTWAKIEEGSTVRVGMDDFSLRLLGPLDSIKAPLVGKEVKQEQADITAHRGKHMAKVLSPVSGVVTAINPVLREQGSLANEHPFSEGWIMRIHSKNLRQNLRNLMLNAETEDFMGKEINGLYGIIEEKVGPLAADGGFLGNDIYGCMPEIGWKRLAKRFLRT